MQLRINASDPYLVEDHFGSPIFRFQGIHLSDLNDIVDTFNRGVDVEELENEIDELRNKLDNIESILNDYDLTDEDKISELEFQLL